MFAEQKALLIHSNWAMRRMTKAQLNAQGWKVTTVKNAEEAYAALNTGNFQMIAIERGIRDSSGKPLKLALARNPKTAGAEIKELGGNPLFNLPSGLSIR